MTEDEIHKVAAVEHSHWWYCGIREITVSLLTPFLAPPMRILDVGCGTGGNLEWLRAFGDARGIDVDPLCIHYCRQKGLDVGPGSMTDLQQAPGSLDLLTMFDVLYHVEPHETVGVLRGMAEAIRPGGLIAFREPALDIAGGAHDRAVNGRQRFTVPGITRALGEAGFEPLRATYLNTLLFPPIVAIRRLQALWPQQQDASDVEPLAAPVNAALLAVMRVEPALLKMMNLPFGVSLFAAARRVR